MKNANLITGIGIFLFCTGLASGAWVVEGRVSSHCEKYGQYVQADWRLTCEKIKG